MVSSLLGILALAERGDAGLGQTPFVGYNPSRGGNLTMPSTLASVTESVRKLSRPQKVRLLKVIGEELIEEDNKSVLSLFKGRDRQLFLALMPTKPMQSWSLKEAMKFKPELKEWLELAKDESNFRTIMEVDVQFDE